MSDGLPINLNGKVSAYFMFSGRGHLGNLNPLAQIQNCGMCIRSKGWNSASCSKKTSSTTYLLFCISYGKKGGNSRIIQKFECMPPPAWSPLLFGTQEKETNLSNIPWGDTGHNKEWNKKSNIVSGKQIKRGKGNAKPNGIAWMELHVTVVEVEKNEREIPCVQKYPESTNRVK